MGDETFKGVYAEACVEEEAGHFTLAARLYERAEDLRDTLDLDQVDTEPLLIADEPELPGFDHNTGRTAPVMF